MFDQTPYQTPHAKNYGLELSQREISIWRNVRLNSQVGIQMFKLKKRIAAIIRLEILEEDGKRESRRGRTSGWIRKEKRKEISIISYRN